LVFLQREQTDISREYRNEYALLFEDYVKASRLQNASNPIVPYRSNSA
jgi:hypothetical protein